MVWKAARMVNFALASAAALAAAASPAFAQDGRIWSLSGLDEKKPARIFLGYGAPESDDSFGGFSCKPKSGAVTVFIAETSEKLKPGKSEVALLSVGDAQAKAMGELKPNEEAGVPSFEGRIGADDPIFAALARGETLTVAVGPSRQTAPLKGATEKFRKFAAACGKP